MTSQHKGFYQTQISPTHLLPQEDRDRRRSLTRWRPFRPL